MLAIVIRTFASAADFCCKCLQALKAPVRPMNSRQASPAPARSLSAHFRAVSAEKAPELEPCDGCSKRFLSVFACLETQVSSQCFMVANTRRVSVSASIDIETYGICWVSFCKLLFGAVREILIKSLFGFICSVTSCQWYCSAWSTQLEKDSQCCHPDRIDVMCPKEHHECLQMSCKIPHY